MLAIAVLLIAVVMSWLVLATRRPNVRLTRSRAAHPAAIQSSSVHIVHLGRED